MKRTYKALLLSTFMIFGIYSCSLSTNTSDTKIKASKPENSKGLVGKAVFPASRKQESNFRIKNHGFKTKATVTDIGSVSTISVITLGQNTSIATGLTDVLGNFQLDMSKLTLTANAIYILEASKRTGEDVETIRTYIKWNGTSWESITTGDVIINENTTAISIIASYLSVSSIDLISKIDPANLTDIFDSTNANVLISKDDITNVAKLVTSVLLGERDPIALIKYDATKPYKYYVDQVYNYNNIATKNGCTGCSFIGADFSNSGASLAGKDLSYADLSGQDLSKQDLSGTILIGADLSGATLPKDLSYLNLSDTNLTGQNLTQMDVKGTNFSRANLTGTILSDETTLKDLTQARFTEANFTNASLVGANLSKVYLFETVMDNTNIKKANFEKADLTGVNLSNVQGKDFTDVSFKDTTLIGSSFSGLDLTNIDLSTANVQGSDFSKTIIYNKVINTNLQNCDFSEANIQFFYAQYLNISGANFSKATLKYIDFKNINAKNSDFSEATLDDIYFSDSNFESTSFQKAIFLNNFYINNSNLRKSIFDEAKVNSSGSINSSDISYASIVNADLTNVTISVTNADYAKFDNSKIYSFKGIGDFFINNKYSVNPPKSQSSVFIDTQTTEPHEFTDARGRIYTYYSYTKNSGVEFSYSSTKNETNRINSELVFDSSTFYDYGNWHSNYTSNSYEYGYYYNTFTFGWMFFGNNTCSETRFLRNTNNQVTRSVGGVKPDIDYETTKYDIEPSNSIKGISFKNTIFSDIYYSYYPIIYGSFVNSDFTGAISSQFVGYCKNCNFTNSSIQNIKIVSINSNFMNVTASLSDSYIKDSSLQITGDITNSLLINSNINISTTNDFSGLNNWSINSTNNFKNVRCSKQHSSVSTITDNCNNVTVNVSGASSYFVDFCSKVGTYNYGFGQTITYN